MYISNKEYLEIFRNIDLAEIFITLKLKLTEGEGPENAFRLSENNIVSVLCSIAEEKSATGHGKYY